MTIFSPGLSPFIPTPVFSSHLLGPAPKLPGRRGPHTAGTGRVGGRQSLLESAGLAVKVLLGVLDCSFESSC